MLGNRIDNAKDRAKLQSGLPAFRDEAFEDWLRWPIDERPAKPTNMVTNTKLLATLGQGAFIFFADYHCSAFTGFESAKVFTGADATQHIKKPSRLANLGR